MPEHLDPDAVLERLHFDLPQDRIAQTGAEPRDSSRLMVVGQGGVSHRVFHDLPELLVPGDLLVFNESRVIPARVMAHKPAQGAMGGGRVEVMLLRQEQSEGEGQVWSAYLKPAKRAGHELWLGDPADRPVRAEVVGVLPDGARLLRFENDLWPQLERIGTLPLPPYISSDPAAFAERYQTVYARTPGSVAAPTAGLHFTAGLLAQLAALRVERRNVTLHVGAGTFKPISGRVADHTMHAERYDISPDTADAVNRARASGRRVIAVGTTTVRALQSAWDGSRLRAGAGDTSIFITPGYTRFVPDVLITNLHLPGSTLLLLVSAFAGVARVRSAYDEALGQGYRFYSLGDAMWLERAGESG